MTKNFIFIPFIKKLRNAPKIGVVRLKGGISLLIKFKTPCYLYFGVLKHFLNFIVNRDHGGIFQRKWKAQHIRLGIGKSVFTTL